MAEILTGEQALEFIIESRGQKGVVLAAPHASDGETSQLVQESGRVLNITTLTARWLGMVPLEAAIDRLNVNRPTQGEPEQDSGNERFTPEAKRVWLRWRKKMLEAAHGPLNLYIEVHTNDDPLTADAIEIASVGLAPEPARNLKLLFNALFVDLGMVGARIEPVDRLKRWKATLAKQYGSFTLPKIGLQIELPIAVLNLILQGNEMKQNWIRFLRGLLAIIPTGKEQVSSSPAKQESLREALTPHERVAKATERIRTWFERKLDQDAREIARLYRTSRDTLVDKIASVYHTHLSNDPTFVKARLTGAGQHLNRIIDDEAEHLSRQIGQLAVNKMEQMRHEHRTQTSHHRRDLATDVGHTSATHELTTGVVGGGTFYDRLFHITDGMKSAIKSGLRQGLLGGETFEQVRDRIGKVFGVNKLYEPKQSAYGSVKIYKNEARRQWNMLMDKLAERNDGKAIWYAILEGPLAESTTPGCAARHGFDTEDIGEMPPHHFNCRCTIMVVEQDADLTVYQEEGRLWLEQHGWTRKQAQLEEAMQDKITYQRAAVYCPDREGKVWAIKPHGQNFWALPGGHLEPGESPDQAAMREMTEETGVVVHLQGYLGSIARPWNTTHVYKGEFRSRGKVLTGEEIDVISRVAIDDLVAHERDFLKSLQLSEADFDPAAHPRVPAGQPGGGQFGGGGGKPKIVKTKAMHKSISTIKPGDVLKYVNATTGKTKYGTVVDVNEKKHAIGYKAKQGGGDKVYYVGVKAMSDVYINGVVYKGGGLADVSGIGELKLDAPSSPPSSGKAYVDKSGTSTGISKGDNISFVGALSGKQKGGTVLGYDASMGLFSVKSPSGDTSKYKLDVMTQLKVNEKPVMSTPFGMGKAAFIDIPKEQTASLVRDASKKILDQETHIYSGDAAKDVISKDGAREFVWKASDHEQYTGKLHIYNNWDSSSSTVSSSYLRAAVSDKFGGDIYVGKEKFKSPQQVRDDRYNDANWSGKSKESVSKGFDRFVDTQYALTQKMLKDQPDTITLYRGIRMEYGQAQGFKVGALGKINIGALSSFSSSRHVADGFGDVTIAIKVPKEHIFGYYDSGFGVTHEKEYGVMGDNKDWQARVEKNSRLSGLHEAKKKDDELPTFDVDADPENDNWIRIVAGTWFGEDLDDRGTHGEQSDDDE